MFQFEFDQLDKRSIARVHVHVEREPATVRWIFVQLFQQSAYYLSIGFTAEYDSFTIGLKAQTQKRRDSNQKADAKDSYCQSPDAASHTTSSELSIAVIDSNGLHE